MLKDNDLGNGIAPFDFVINMSFQAQLLFDEFLKKGIITKEELDISRTFFIEYREILNIIQNSNCRVIDSEIFTFSLFNLEICTKIVENKYLSTNMNNLLEKIRKSVDIYQEIATIMQSIATNSKRICKMNVVQKVIGIKIIQVQVSKKKYGMIRARVASKQQLSQKQVVSYTVSRKNINNLATIYKEDKKLMKSLNEMLLY